MSQTSEAVKRIQQIVSTLETKKIEVERAFSDFKRAEIALEGAREALKQIRQQLAKELFKLDPELQEIVTTEEVA